MFVLVMFIHICEHGQQQTVNHRNDVCSFTKCELKVDCSLSAVLMMMHTQLVGDHSDYCTSKMR